MQLSSAILCDFAQVRGGLLFVSSGGITRIWRSQYPAPIGLCLAIVIEAHPTEAVRPHELQIILQGQDGERFVEHTGGFQLAEESLDQLETGENIQIPQVLDLRNFGVPGPSPYTIEILIDGSHARTIRFLASDKRPASAGH